VVRSCTATWCLVSCCYPRLRELELHNAPELGPDGVAKLTELRQLTRLHLHGIGHRRCLDALLVSTSKVGSAVASAGVHGEGGREYCDAWGCLEMGQVCRAGVAQRSGGWPT
jgi:hypothetical protein